MSKKNKKQGSPKKKPHIVQELSAAQKPVVHARIHPELFRMLSHYCDFHKATKQDVIDKALGQFLRKKD
jgi:hypothetical protein